MEFHEEVDRQRVGCKIMLPRKVQHHQHTGEMTAPLAAISIIFKDNYSYYKKLLQGMTQTMDSQNQSNVIYFPGVAKVKLAVVPQKLLVYALN
nr:hypothetical protein [Tanacetum cinerariifolium]